MFINKEKGMVNMKREKRYDYLYIILCVVLSSLFYVVISYYPIHNRISQYNVINNIDNISDEQLLYIAANDFGISDILKNVEYIDHTQHSRYGCTLLYMIKLDDNTIRQYYYSFEDHYGYGTFSGEHDLILWYDTYYKQNKGKENDYELAGDKYILDESLSEKECSRVLLPEDWDFRIEKAVWRRYWIGFFLLRLILVFIVGTFYYNKSFSGYNALVSILQYASAFFGSGLILCLSEYLIRMAIYTNYYMNTHTAVMGGFGASFSFRILYHFISVLIHREWLLLIAFLLFLTAYIILLSIIVIKKKKCHLCDREKTASRGRLK